MLTLFSCLTRLRLRPLTIILLILVIRMPLSSLPLHLPLFRQPPLARLELHLCLQSFQPMLRAQMRLLTLLHPVLEVPTLSLQAIIHQLLAALTLFLLAITLPVRLTAKPPLQATPKLLLSLAQRLPALKLQVPGLLHPTQKSRPALNQLLQAPLHQAAALSLANPRPS